MILARFAISMLAVALLACALSYSQADQPQRHVAPGIATSVH